MQLSVQTSAARTRLHGEVVVDASVRARRFHSARGTPDAYWTSMRPLDGTRLALVVTRLFQDVYYWCGISGWGLAGLFAVFIGFIGTFTNFRMDRLLVRARASERSSRMSAVAPFVR